MNSLRRRQVEVRCRTSGFSTLSEVCRIQQQHSPEWGGKAGKGAAGDPIVVVIVRPTELDEAPELARVITVHMPKIACWCYDDAASPKLRAVTASDIRAWSSEGAGEHAAVEAGEARRGGQSHEHGGLAKRHAHATGARPIAGRRLSAPVLTEAEIAMLLSDQPEAPGGFGVAETHRPEVPDVGADPEGSDL